MQISLVEAARMLGRSERQVRYLIKNGQIRAHKVAGRWLIDNDDLPLTDGQKEAHVRKAAEVSEVVHEALASHTKAPGQKHFSVRTMKTFDHAVEACRQASALLGDEHPATRALESALVKIAQGCHRFHQREKVDGFRIAREHVSEAVARLFLLRTDEADALGTKVEGELLPGLAGLLRRSEKRGYQ